MHLQEEYNRSAFDSEDTTPENEVNQDIIDDENVENSWTIELNLMIILEKYFETQERYLIVENVSWKRNDYFLFKL